MIDIVPVCLVFIMKNCLYIFISYCLTISVFAQQPDQSSSVCADEEARWGSMYLQAVINADFRVGNSNRLLLSIRNKSNHAIESIAYRT